MIRIVQTLCRVAVQTLLPAAALLAAGHAAADDFPNRTIELVVPFAPGGGTDALARGFAELSEKHSGQSMVVVNKPGASGSVGWQYLMNAKPDGYHLAIATVELTTIQNLGLAKYTYDDMTPIARLNADPAAITVRADAPWNTIEEFLAAAKKTGGKTTVGNAGVGSIWHLAAAALEDKTGVTFNHVPFQGAGPAVLSLMGGYVDAVAVSPAEVTTYVQSGKLKMLVVMADQRVPGFEKVPTLKERHIDLSIGTWRGIVAPKNTPPAIVAYLKKMTQDAANEPAFHTMLDKQNLGFSYADDAAFRANMARDAAYFKVLMTKLDIKN
jgi:tripartite-type tricarboxylate transporter receptor subunit TctC